MSVSQEIPGQPVADGDGTDGDGSLASACPAPSPTLFRAVNEEVERITDSFAFDGELELVCECDREGCLQRIAVSRDAYETVRRFPTRFLLKREHIGADDRIVEATDGYVVVEKLGPSAESAIRLDPRRPTAAAEAR